MVRIMKATLRKMGNSQGVLIPKAIIEQLGIADALEMSVENGAVVLRPPVHAIELQVKKSGANRLTLTQKTSADRLPVDIQERGLHGNDDHAEFYRAVAQKLDSLHRDGHDVIYKDVSY